MVAGICIARGLPKGGQLLCCDISEEWTAIAQRYWERAGVAEHGDLGTEPALGLRDSPAFDGT